MPEIHSRFMAWATSTAPAISQYATASAAAEALAVGRSNTLAGGAVAARPADEGEARRTRPLVVDLDVPPRTNGMIDPPDCAAQYARAHYPDAPHGSCRTVPNHEECCG